MLGRPALNAGVDVSDSSGDLAVVGVSTDGLVQLVITDRVIRMTTMMLFFTDAPEVTLWLEFYTTGRVFSILCDEIADCWLILGHNHSFC